MPFLTRRSAAMLAGLGLVSAAIVAGAVWSGVYDIGADAPHTRPVFSLLQSVRERSIAVRAAKLDPPDLADPARIRQGAGNYAAMCATCHRAPGGGDTELSRGLYPAPPDLTREAVEPRVAFWAIKHGIKASGMPAWGRSMDDASMWSLAAFVQALPRLDAAQYAGLVEASGGHSHGAGSAGGADAAHHDGHEHETSAAAKPAMTPHVHADGSVHEHAAAPAAPAAATPTQHVHADGSVHEHPAPAGAPAQAEDEHDHHHEPPHP